MNNVRIGSLSRNGLTVVLLTLGALAALGTLAPRTARAQEWATPPDPQSAPPAPASPAAVEPGAVTTVTHEGAPLDVELGAVASYVTPPIRGGVNPFGAGFGGRIGLAYAGVYVGISVLDFLGGTDVDVSYRAMLYGLELGYGLRVPAFGRTVLTVRPQIGVGDAAVYYTDPRLAADVVTSASGSSSSSSDTLTVNNVYVEPALSVMLASGSHFAALRTSALVIPGIQYGGADATTWLCSSTRLELGFVF